MDSMLDDTIEFDGEGPTEAFFPEEISTPRLELDRLCYDTISARHLHRYLGATEGEEIEKATAHTLWDPHETVGDTADYIDSCIEDWNKRKAATYLIRRDEPDRPADVVGKTTLKIGWERRTGWPDIFIRKPFWGNEYSGERMHALFELAFKHLRLEVVGSSCAVNCKRVRRPIERYMNEHGGEHTGVLPNWGVPESGPPMDCHYYTITREQYIDE